MDTVDLAIQSENIREAAAGLLVEHFNEPHGWPSLASAREQLTCVIDAGFARAILDAGVVAGWVGGLPEYKGRVWELHPIVVHRQYRLRGIGRTLVKLFESEAAKHAALTFTLGKYMETSRLKHGPCALPGTRPVSRWALRWANYRVN